ncbi:MAG: hypothetical protein MI751_02690 [Pseudomonadales bacterium]|nr:hypothetical protein [Pseudomonadales bacterium]
MLTVIRLAFFSLLLLLTLVSLLEYSGSSWVFLLYSAVFIGLLFNGLSRGALYFDTFIGVFLWLGFWLKTAFRVAFMDGKYYVSTGAFDGSGAMHDAGLMAASIGGLGFLLASLLRRQIWTPSRELESSGNPALYAFYLRFKHPLWLAFGLLTLGVCISNVYFGFYQRGQVARTVLPWGLNGIFAWLLQFGLASIAAFFIHFELREKERFTWAALFFPLFESFSSNLSLFSRGMILNVSGFLAAGIRVIAVRKVPWVVPVFLGGGVFIGLFAVSVYGVNELRIGSYVEGIETMAAQKDPIEPATLRSEDSPPASAKVVKSPEVEEKDDWPAYVGSGEGAEEWRRSVRRELMVSLFLDRWVGVEGVLAVTSSDQQGWLLWEDAWAERFEAGSLTLYDSRLIDSPYKDDGANSDRNHFVSLPGIVAFAWYPGVAWFALLVCFLAGVTGAILEAVIWYLGAANPFLTGLLSQVVAFRFVSFGYVPAQSYLLLGAVLLNVFMIYLLERGLHRIRERAR